jgi:hypothetical protein
MKNASRPAYPSAWFTVTALFVNSVVLWAAYALPMLAANDDVSIPFTLWGSRLAPYACLAVAGGFIWLGTRLEYRVVRVMILIGCIAVVDFCALNWLCSSDRRDRVFLHSFAGRCLHEVGLRNIEALFDATREGVRLGRRARGSLAKEEIPTVLRRLYGVYRPYGHVLFDETGYTSRLQVMWGGAVYRWGVEVTQGTPVAGGFQKTYVMPISTNILCFLAR